MFQELWLVAIPIGSSQNMSLELPLQKNRRKSLLMQYIEP